MMHRRAFTLIEVLLVLLLLGVLAAFVLPDLGVDVRRRSLVESADRLRSLIVMCHAKAMQDGREYRIYFPGTPDPHDKFADKEIDIPWETLQPIVERQSDPLNDPDAFEVVPDDWARLTVLQERTRCVAVFPGRPSFEIKPESPIAGPSITEGLAPFVHLNFHPDGSTDWVTFVLTDLPPDVVLQSHHVGRIVNLIVDGRVGQAWMQRALRVAEVELLQEYGASPLLHIDFTRPEEITEANILEVHVRQGGGASGGRGGRRSTEGG